MAGRRSASKDSGCQAVFRIKPFDEHRGEADAVRDWSIIPRRIRPLDHPKRNPSKFHVFANHKTPVIAAATNV